MPRTSQREYAAHAATAWIDILPHGLSYCLDALCSAFSRAWVSAGIFSVA
jgi:hypothetical protein